MAVMKNQKTGMWEVRTYYKDWTGTRRQKTKRGFAKKSETQEWECAFKLKDEMNINMKFKDFAELYLSDIQPRIKYNSFLTKKHIIETKILPYFGHRKLNEIRPADVIQWQNEIMKLKKDNGEAYSPTYLKTIHNQLSAILNHAVNMYDLKNNVARKAGSMGKEESKEIMFWTQEEYQAFIEQVADKPISYYAFEILYWTGIREGELLALTPADFDFVKKTLRINKSYQRLEGKDVITDPKTPKSNRVIVMSDFLAVEIEDFISKLDGISNDDRIFTISKSYLHHEMDRGAKLAGVKRIEIHGLRHSHISLLIHMGYSALAIATRLQNEEFKKQIDDIIEVGLKRYHDKYQSSLKNESPFVLYEKYSRRDVSLLMNCGRDLSSTMYGMKRIDDDVFIFVTYHKEESTDEQKNYVDGKPDYADAFEDNMIFRWDSQIGRGVDSSYVSDVVNTKRKHLLVKKSDAESNFYYMGEFDIVDVRAARKRDNNGKERDITKFEMKMHHPVREDLLRYLQSNLQQRLQNNTQELKAI